MTELEVTEAIAKMQNFEVGALRGERFEDDNAYIVYFMGLPIEVYELS